VRVPNSVEELELSRLFSLLRDLLQDLRTTLQPFYESLLDRLLNIAPRNCAAETLSALLETLSHLFKHLLQLNIGEDESNFSLTWEKLLPVVAKCKSEVQRALAEVWAGVLRRSKKEDRRRIVQTMLNSALETNITDFVSWSLVFTCKVCNIIAHIFMSNSPLHRA